MGVETVARNTERPAGLDGRTACEAFQATAAAHPDRPAIRTRGDEILAVRDAVESIQQVVVVDGEPPPGTISLDELAGGGGGDFEFEATWRAVQPDDVLTLIYTSGTTGPPKGVQITHANICETVRSYDELIQFPDGGRIVSYLPMAHVAERNVSHYLPMLCGF